MTAQELYEHDLRVAEVFHGPRADRDWLTPSEVAALLQIDERRILDACFSGGLKDEAYRVGRTLRIPSAAVEARAQSDSLTKQTVVYFIQSGDAGPIKIGLAWDAHKRLAALQTGHPEELRLLGTIPGNAEVERRLHDRFSHCRIRGEWFAPDPELIRAAEESSLA